MPLFFSKSGSWIKKCLVLWFACTIAAAMSLYFFSPRLIHSEYVKTRIHSLILAETGHNVQFSDFTINILPVPNIAFHELAVKINEDFRAEIKNLKIFFNTEAALKGRIQADRIDIARPAVIYSKNRPPSRMPQLITCMNSLPHLLKTILSFLPDNQDSVSLNIRNAESGYSGNINSSIVLSKKTKKISVKTDIADIKFDSSEFLPPEIKEFINLGKIKIKKAVISAVLDSNNQIKARIMVHRAKFMSAAGRVILDSDKIETGFRFSGHKLEINTEKITFNYPEAQISLHFSADVQNTGFKNPDLRFEGTNINIAQAGRMSAHVFANNEITTTIFNILKSGFVPSVSVIFHSSSPENLFHEKSLDLKGRLENGSINIPGTALSADHVYGNAEISRGILTINTTGASLKNSKLENGRLAVNLSDYPDFPFNGSFFLHADLSELPETLSRLFGESLLTKEMSLVHDIRGKAEIRLDLRLKTGSDTPIVNIRADRCKISGNYERIPGKIDLENLSFTYSPDQITISGLTGIVNKSRFKDMNLTLELKKPYTMSIDSGTASIDIGTTISWARQFDGIRKKILPLRFGKGTIFLDSIQVAGPVSAPELWKFELAGTGKNMNLSASQYHDQIKNMSCRFNVTNHFVNLNELQGIIYDISWLSPMISRKDLDSFALPVTMEKGSLGSGYRGTFFRTCLKFAKGPELVMDMQGKKISDLFPVSLKISDSEFSDAHLSFSRDSDGPKFSFTGVLDTRTIDKMLVPESFWAGQLNNLTESQPVIIRKTDNGNLNISISHINLDSAFAESPALRFDIKTMPFKRIDLHADEIGIKKWIITNTDAALVLKNDTSYIRLKKAFLCDLDSTGFINLKGKTVQATVKFSAPDKPNIQKLLTCLFNDQHLMDGRYSLDIDIRTSADKNRLAESLNGSIKLEAAKGRIYKLTLLSRILSLLNISKIFRGKLPNLTQHGFAYETLFVDADIKNSRILLKKAIIDGNDMTLVFSGWIDPIKDDMNITCLISPFKTIDLIIKNIPVVNTLLGGRLISVPVKATGKLSDPDVMPLHPSAVGKGLINMMGTILKTPVKLWDKINGKK